MISSETSINWYAVKVYADRPVIMKYFAAHRIEVYYPVVAGRPFLGPIVFLHCTKEDVLRAKSEWFRQLRLYRDPERINPQVIHDQEMDNFRMVMDLRDQEVHPVEIHDPKFLEGQKVRVLDGPLKGAVGVIKRIKGDRRLVVSVSGIAAVATSFVHPDLLEKV